MATEREKPKAQEVQAAGRALTPSQNKARALVERLTESAQAGSATETEEARQAQAFLQGVWHGHAIPYIRHAPPARDAEAGDEAEE